MKRRLQYPTPSTLRGGQPSWSDLSLATSYQKQCQAGAALEKHSLCLYASTKLTAKDFAIACHYAALAGTPGGNFSKYVVPPDQATIGNYQRHLDKVLPSGGPVYHVQTPCVLQGRGERVLLPVPTVPLHEALDREFRADAALLARAQAQERPKPRQSAHKLASVCKVSVANEPTRAC